jgi:hypothetical protein
MLHWYCKTTYNLKQISFPKQLIFWNRGSTKSSNLKSTTKNYYCIELCESAITGNLNLLSHPLKIDEYA